MDKKHATTTKAHDEESKPKKSSPHEISIKSTGVEPAEFHAKVNTPVKWVNVDDKNHVVNFNVATVTGSVPPPSSPEIRPDGGYEYTFIVPGSYEYHLENHKGIGGKVIVT